MTESLYTFEKIFTLFITSVFLNTYMANCYFHKAKKLLILIGLIAVILFEFILFISVFFYR